MRRCICSVNLLYNPPLLCTTFESIHDVADAHTIRTISFLAEANPFQKFSKATIRSLFCVSIHDSSSINIIFFFSLDNLMTSFNASNASSQFLGCFFISYPASLRDDVNAYICSFIPPSDRPAC